MSFVVHHGDCMEVMPIICERSIDAIVTDPPYGIDFQSARRTKDERLDKIANDKTPFTAWIPGPYRVAKDTAALLCFCRWDVAEVFRAEIEAAGWNIKSQVIWDRLNHGTGDLNGAFGPRHDVIWFATKGAFSFPWKRPASVLPFERIGGGQLVHPNQKPVPLMEYLCRSVCPRGGTVLDPFTGSGATGQGALIAGCNFIGCELDARYADMASKNISAADPVGTQMSINGIA